MEIKNKVAVITGATGGIGSEVSLALAREGARLAISGRSEEGLMELAGKLSEAGASEVKHYLCDLTDPSCISDFAHKLSEDFGRVDMLFNIAGIGVYKKIEDVSIDEWSQTFAVNVTAPYILTKELLPLLDVAGESVILNVGSGMGTIALPGRSVYCASKFALRGMSLSLAKELEDKNIKVMHISLGSTLTDFGPLSVDDKKDQQEQGKRYFTPQWVAQKFVEIIKEDKIQDEVTLFPSHYVKDELELS